MNRAWIVGSRTCTQGSRQERTGRYRPVGAISRRKTARSARSRSPRVTSAMRLANGRQLPNKQARHPRRICCCPSLSALAAGAGPGIEGHAFRIGLLPYGSLGPAELSPDLAGGRPCARLRLQLANVFAGPSSPLCSLLGHWNLRSELKREFDLITVYGCQTRRASCPGNLPYASASFDEFPSEAIERAFVAPHCRRREDRGGMRARSRRAARRQVRQTDKSSKCLFASGCRAHLSGRSAPEHRFEVVSADSGIAFACHGRTPCVRGQSRLGAGLRADWQAIGLCREDAAIKAG